MMSKKPKKYWSMNLEESGVRIRLWKRSSMFWYSTIVEGGRKVRRSLETGDRALARA